MPSIALILYRVHRETLYTLAKHLFSGSVKFFFMHPVDYGNILKGPTTLSSSFKYLIQTKFWPILCLKVDGKGDRSSNMQRVSGHSISNQKA